MTEPDERFIKRTREIWSQHYGRSITDEEAQEIVDNLVGSARILIDWYEADKEGVGRSVEAAKT